MVQGSVHTRFTGGGCALLRLLAQLGAVEAKAPRQAFAERLGQWLGWTDAIALSGALNTAPAASPAAPAPRGAGAASAHDELERLRSALAHGINTDRDLAPPKARARQPAIEPEFPHYRRRYLNRQQAMDMSIGALRSHLRATLAARSAPMAKLAAVDAVMEQVLGAQERRLLAGVPALLERHFEQLRLAASATWLDTFCQDLRGVLLAELDLRMQPLEGLLAALRSSSPSGRP
jgi:hypothetical protein